ncbi:hypothetical protein BDZ94DRAFT_594227 [Collybia nuda]|uniref:Uncharacterized protein n=1 Tax=Collybia nuda TaxID=64659 RepID=A0A9P6CF34_9AGAR|nr:hypothetical protein BDZ94DRAFT_594227 [Collybia nuda]
MEVQMTLLPWREHGNKIDPDSRMSLERPDFQEFLSKLTIPPFHPQFHRLYPVQNNQIDLSQYLPQILSAAYCSTNFLHFPGRLTWSKSMTYALVFSPFSMIGAQLGPWERSHELSSLQGYKRELFYSNDTSIYYAGTFRCIETSKWFPEGINLPRNVSAEAIAEVALGKNSSCSAPYKATISKSFTDGIMKVECIVLECIGFSRFLYNALLEEYSPDTSLKRSSAYSDEDSNKKPRWKMG